MQQPESHRASDMTGVIGRLRLSVLCFMDLVILRSKKPG